MAQLIIFVQKKKPTFNIQQLQCHIASVLLNSLGAQSLDQKLEEINRRLNDLQPVAEKLQVGLSAPSPIVRRIEFFVEDGLIDPNKIQTPKTANSYAAFQRLLEKETAFSDKPPNLVDDPDISSKIQSELPNVTNSDANDPKISRTTHHPDGSVSTVESDLQMYSQNAADEHALRVYFRRTNLAVSPLFDWLLHQPKQSVDQIQLFDQAVKIYGDPWVALGVIGHLLGHDAGNIANASRKHLALACSKVKTPLETNPKWHAGVTYHFWSFLIRQLVLPNGMARKERVLSFLHETVWQADSQERSADNLGGGMGRQIRELLKQHKSCGH